MRKIELRLKSTLNDFAEHLRSRISDGGFAIQDLIDGQVVTEYLVSLNYSFLSENDFEISAKINPYRISDGIEPVSFLFTGRFIEGKIYPLGEYLKIQFEFRDWVFKEKNLEDKMKDWLKQLIDELCQSFDAKILYNKLLEAQPESPAKGDGAEMAEGDRYLSRLEKGIIQAHKELKEDYNIERITDERICLWLADNGIVNEKTGLAYGRRHINIHKNELINKKKLIM